MGQEQMTRLRVSAVFHRSVDEVLRSIALQSFLGISDAEGYIHSKAILSGWWSLNSVLCVSTRETCSQMVYDRERAIYDNVSLYNHVA